MNTKLYAVTPSDGLQANHCRAADRSIQFFITVGQASDDNGAAALLSSLPDVEWLLADRDYDADWFTEALIDRGITPCIPGRKSRSKSIKYDKRRYKRRNRIERMFGRLKDWRRTRDILHFLVNSICRIPVFNQPVYLQQNRSKDLKLVVDFVSERIIGRAEGNH